MREFDLRKKEFIALELDDLCIELAYDKLIYVIRKDVSTLWRPVHCSTIQSVVYHEFAHILDAILGLSNNEQFLHICMNKIFDVGMQISGYAASRKTKEKQMSEIIAEAFAEYTMSSEYANEAVKLIGELIDKEYMLNENSREFNINYNFGENIVAARLK